MRVAVPDGPVDRPFQEDHWGTFGLSHRSAVFVSSMLVVWFHII